LLGLALRFGTSPQASALLDLGNYRKGRGKI
jgi:hypothetical protein